MAVTVDNKAKYAVSRPLQQGCNKPETEMKQMSFRFQFSVQVEDLVPGPFGSVNRLSSLFTALCYIVLLFSKTCAFSWDKDT